MQLSVFLNAIIILLALVELLVQELMAVGRNPV